MNLSNFSGTETHRSPEEKRALLAELLQQKSNQDSNTFPLSYGQQALWFLYQSNPSSTSYNVSIPARIPSQVDVDALKQAFQELVNRHQTLRTTFTLQPDGTPAQTVHNPLPVCFEQIDAATWCEEDLHQVVTETHRRPFDLQQGPIFRVTLFTHTNQDHVLLLSLHHIVYDAWSIGPLLNDAQKLYAAAKEEIAPSLPSLAQQYSSYVQWQTQNLMGAEGERLWDYWKEQLAGDLPTLDLPADRLRPLHPSNKGDSYLFKLSQVQAQAIKDLARTEGTTTFNVLMAVFQVLLYRYTGQTDILVGSPMGGRPQAEFEQIVGYFVNPAVIRGKLADNLPFKDFLSQLRTTILDAMDHQDYPFPLLVERLQPNRDQSRSPIFQVLFNFLKLQQIDAVATLLVPDQAGANSVNWADLELDSFPLEQQEGQFDLTLEVIETQDELIGLFKYSTDLFNTDTIERMAEHFQILLSGILINPEQTVGCLPILSETERHQILTTWNETQTDYPHDQCLHQIFEAQVEQTPDAIAVVFEDQQLSYQNLNTRANQLAHYLKSLGMEPEARVGICIERSIDMVVGMLGILKAGGTYVPLDPAYPQERLAFIAEDAQIAVLLTQSHLTVALPNAQIVRIDNDWQAISAANEGVTPPESSVKPTHLAYLIYTSGSTGQPKGVQIPHNNVVNLLHSVQAQPGLDASDTLLAVASLSFDISVAEVFLPLMVGAKLVIASRETTADGLQLLKAMEIHQPTFMQPTPATWRMLLVAGWTGSQNLKMISTGEPLPKELATQLRPLGKELWNLYGPTETTIWSAGYQVQEDTLGITIGYPIANTQLYILDSQLQPVPIGITGELHIGGAGVASGYLNRPELTEEKFIPPPLGTEDFQTSDRLYKTGDLARWLPNGQVECLGRLDYQVKIRGFRIELGAIETGLLQMPQIKEVVVVSRKDNSGGNVLVAYLVTAADLSPNQLRRHLKAELPDYMVPSAFVFLETLPLTPNGKVDRRALPAPAPNDQTVETEFVAPRKPTEHYLSQLWCDLLKLKKIGIYDNFFELGGHSLQATQLMSRIREQFAIELSLHTLFESPTVAELGNRIETIRWATSTSSSTSTLSEERTLDEDLEDSEEGAI